MDDFDGMSPFCTIAALSSMGVLHRLLSTVLAVDDIIARTATEDEEAAAEIHASRLTCPALTMVRDSG